MTERFKIPAWVMSLIGVVVIVALWWILGMSLHSTGPKGASYRPVPTPPEVIATIFKDGIGYYWKNFQVTLIETGIGYFWGNLIALVLSAVVLVVPAFEGILMQVAVVTYCVPIVAIGGLAIIILGGANNPGESSPTAIFLAALSVFFTTVVSAMLGLKAADKAALDVVSVYGGSKLTQLIKVRLIAAIPNIMSGLQIAVPAAFLGAVLGEYFGKIETAVGPMLVSAQVQLDSARVWAIFLLCALIALAGYGLVGLIGRLIAPWAKQRGGRA